MLPDPKHIDRVHKCNLFFDSEPQRSEDLFNVAAVHSLSFRQSQPRALLLLLLTQADRCGERPVSGRVAEGLPSRRDRWHDTEGRKPSAASQQCWCCATKHGPPWPEKWMMKSPEWRERSFRVGKALSLPASRYESADSTKKRNYH